jgi:hypothetical protein
MPAFYRAQTRSLAAPEQLNHVADERKEQTEHDSGAQRNVDVAAAQFEIEITGQPAKTEAAQEGGEPTDEEEGEEGDEKPAHSCEAGYEMLLNK